MKVTALLAVARTKPDLPNPIRRDTGIGIRIAYVSQWWTAAKTDAARSGFRRKCLRTSGGYSNPRVPAAIFVPDAGQKVAEYADATTAEYALALLAAISLFSLLGDGLAWSEASMVACLRLCGGYRLAWGP